MNLTLHLFLPQISEAAEYYMAVVLRNVCLLLLLFLYEKYAAEMICSLTVNIILSAYAGRTRESGIDFSVRCNVPKELKVREIDLIALLGNLIENALPVASETVKRSARRKKHRHFQYAFRLSEIWRESGI